MQMVFKPNTLSLKFFACASNSGGLSYAVEERCLVPTSWWGICFRFVYCCSSIVQLENLGLRCVGREEWELSVDFVHHSSYTGSGGGTMVLGSRELSKHVYEHTVW